jgi:hypothetical protein
MSPRPLTQIKHFTDGLVVRWVTTSESPLLYVFVFLDNGRLGLLEKD